MKATIRVTNRLPREYRFAHGYSLFLYDLLLAILKEGDQAEIYNHKFQLKSPDHRKQIKKLRAEELLNWLTQNNYQSEAYLIIYKQLVPGLISDLCYYIYMSLVSSATAYIRVSYSLFRRPFKDTLLLLEWLLAYPAEMLHLFIQSDNSKHYAPDQLTHERKREIISKSIEKIGKSNILDAELIYRLRYEKSFNSGFERFWQPASHIVTNAKDYATEPMDLNYVFQTPEQFGGCWNHIYSFVPMILYYVLNVAETLVSTFAHRKDAHLDITDKRVDMGLILWLKSMLPLGLEGYTDEHIQSFSMLLDGFTLKFQCEECPSKEYSINQRQLLMFYKYGQLRCAACKATRSLI